MKPPKIIQARVLRVDPLKPSLSGHDPFRRIHWEPIDYPARWMKTDVSPNHDNYKKWKELMEVGNVIGNLKVMNDNTINGDSFPELISKPEKQGELNI